MNTKSTEQKLRKSLPKNEKVWVTTYLLSGDILVETSDSLRTTFSLYKDVDGMWLKVMSSTSHKRIEDKINEISKEKKG